MAFVVLQQHSYAVTLVTTQSHDDVEGVTRRRSFSPVFMRLPALFATHKWNACTTPSALAWAASDWADLAESGSYAASNLFVV